MAIRQAAILISALLLAACGPGSADTPQPSPQGHETIGLYSTLPIAWRESEDIKGFLSDDVPAHWALAVMRREGRVITLDTLADPQGALPLPPKSILALAQPRVLTAQENVALDAWVRGGGKVLLFVDPMLTVDSRFAPGDPRRPQDVAMLSPILARWGLELTFDDTQPAGEHVVKGFPVNLAGRFRALGKVGDGSGKAGDVVARCRIEADGLVADCASGNGRIIALADAALLEDAADSAVLSAKRGAFTALLQRLVH